MIIPRRFFLQQGVLFLAATGGKPGELLAAVNEKKETAIQFGILTDVHYADKETADSRYYRNSIPKIRRCIEDFHAAQLDFVIELGDFIDAAKTVEEETRYLKTIDKEYQKAGKRRYYVLGNHCVWTLTKKQFLEAIDQKQSYFSFDQGDFHFIVLDACFRSDGTAYGARNFEWTDTEIPAEERDWLKNVLNETEKKAIVFVHQRLDIPGHYTAKSAATVRKIMEQSGKVIAVFQGHFHKNDYHEINGIHYCTMAAMVEGTYPPNNAYGIVEIHKNGSIQINGFFHQSNYLYS